MADQRADTAFSRAVRTVTDNGAAWRVETDSLGPKKIPAGAYWGIHVSRALDNFPISGSRSRSTRISCSAMPA